MNLSGKSVAALAKFFQIKPEEIMVAHDELDLPPGVAKFKKGGGHGGHNGLRDIISKMGNNKEFYRLRIGIGHPGHKDKVAGFVLTKAPAAEQSQIEQAVDEAVRCIDILLKDDLPRRKIACIHLRHNKTRLVLLSLLIQRKVTISWVLNAVSLVCQTWANQLCSTL